MFSMISIDLERIVVRRLKLYHLVPLLGIQVYVPWYIEVMGMSSQRFYHG